MGSPLIAFLASARSNVLKGVSGKHTLVLGNSSCDLDSFISAVVLSYFYSRRISERGHVFAPLLNLPTVPSSELWRLRPEFGTALRLATNAKDDLDETKGLLGNLITVADIENTPSSSDYSIFAREPATGRNTTSKKEDVVLVDHNAVAIAGYDTEQLCSRLNLVGCIDHHIDESSIPPTAKPRIIQTGIGSCTSLVVKHLRDENLWPADYQESEVAELALAPILIDTFNLKASGDKCSDIDRDAVKFLESQLDGSWDRDSFFDAISVSKSNSLDLLTMPEIFDRDYKEWTETGPSEINLEKLVIGIPSLVRSLSWLVGKAGSPEKFVEAIDSFARNRSEDKVDIVALITKSTGPNGEFRKELALVAFGGTGAKALEVFEGEMSDPLKLEIWQEDEGLLDMMKKQIGERGAYRIWWQGNTEKSRKQVAPALREAARKSL